MITEKLCPDVLGRTPCGGALRDMGTGLTCTQCGCTYAYEFEELCHPFPKTFLELKAIADSFQ